jgi:PKD repeat protein
MRSGLAVVVCLVVLLAGCGSSVSSVSTSSIPLSPTANAGGPYTCTAGLTVNFSGSGSTDPQGDTLIYSWNFGDGSTGTGATPTHIYTTPGSYTASLIVTETNSQTATATSGLSGSATAKVTISAAPLTVTVSNATRAYGASNPTFTSTITGALNGDTFTVAYSTAATASSSVGGYAINATVSGANLANYSVTVVPGALTITTATTPLVVAVNSATRTYGASNPTFTSTITGALNGDTFTVAYSTLATVSSSVGGYAINAMVNGTNLANYNLTTNPGSLTITQAPAATIMVNNVSRAYGTANPTFTYSNTNGILNGDTFVLSYSTSATITSPVGSNTINGTIVGGSSTSNYASVTVLPGTLTITQSLTPLVFTVNNTSRPYYTANPAFTSTASGAVNGDTFTLSYSSVAVLTSPVGAYTVTNIVSGGSSLSNYANVQYASGKLTITAATNPLVATCDSYSRAYGAANPMSGYTTSGLLGSDAVAVVCSTTATTASPIGTYSITPVVSGTAAANYTVQLVPGSLSITGASLMITVNNATRAYGAANPTFSGTTTGAVNGDTFTVNYTTVATASSSVGGYAINATVSGANLANYSLTVNPGTLTITALPPVANVGGPYTGTAGAAMNFTGSASNDPQGETLSYAWNFGDGITGTGVAPTHIYASSGTYTVSLQVTNTSGLTGSASTTAAIAVAPLTDVALTGVVYSGSTPVVGAHVYLLAANTTGYGGAGIAASSSNASLSLLSASETGASDSIGSYVTTGSGGGFSLTGDYTCTSGQQLYLYALGGNVGAGTNAASGLMAVLGSCPSSGASAIYATVNEVTTIAAAYAFAGFATDATHVSSSGTVLAQTGIANAFANAANLATLSTGTALVTTPAGNGAVPQGEINTLANILNGCLISGNCTTLLTTATSDGTSNGTEPTDTATAAINIAHHPEANIAALYGLVSSTPHFSPGLTTVPNDFTVMLAFPGLNYSDFVAIDGFGNVWTASGYTSTVAEFSSSGVPISPSSGYPTGGPGWPEGMAIDALGNIWVSNVNSTIPSVTILSPSGTSLTPSGGYPINAAGRIAFDDTGNAWIGCDELSITGTVTVFNLAISGCEDSVIDGLGEIWTSGVVNNNGSVFKFTSSGVLISPTGGYLPISTSLSFPELFYLSIDANGNLWGYRETFSLYELSNSGAVIESSPGFTGGGLKYATGMSIDGSGHIWLSDFYGSISEFSNSGVAISPTNGFIGNNLNDLEDIAVDGSGNVWITNLGYNTLNEVIGAATPVVTPLAVGVKNNMLGTRP